MPTEIVKPANSVGGVHGKTRTILRNWLMSQGVPNPLPSEKQISRDLGLARATVHRAIISLESEGLVSREGRLRRVTAPMTEHFLDRSIVVVTPYRAPYHKGHRMLGWPEWMNIGTLDAVGRNNLTAVIIAPERLAGNVTQQIIKNHPTGVVIPDYGNNSFANMEAMVQPFLEARLPVAVCSPDFELPGVDQVVSDHAEGARQLTAWLIQQGRRNIRQLNFSGASKTCWIHDRRGGYERAMRAAGLEPLPSLEIPSLPLPAEFTVEQEIEADARYLMGYLCKLDPQVDAIMAITDGVVPSLARALRLLDRDPGGAILLTGYDNYLGDLVKRELEPTPLAATIDKDNVEAGAILVRLVLERSAGKAPREPVRQIIGPKLIIPVPSTRAAS